MRLQQVRLEDWPIEEGAFDLVVSASAWHWIDQALGFRVAHEALRRHGIIGLLWNVAVVGPGSSALHEVVQPAYVRWAPDLAEDLDLPAPEDADNRVDELAATPLFDECRIQRYSWSEAYTAARYVDLLRTFSDHILLPPETAALLLSDIRERIERDLAGTATVDRVTVLKTARAVDRGTEHAESVPAGGDPA